MYFTQEEEDKFLNENYFKNKTNGFFIDIGAHSGVWSSKSFFFEKELNWDGVCVEPSPINFSQLVKNRSCKCLNIALSDKEEFVDFCVHEYINDGNVITGDVVDGVVDGILNNYPDDRKNEVIENINNPKKERLADGTIKDRSVNVIKIKTSTFNNTFDYLDNKNIDFVNIDTEGSELPILKGIDFDKFHINFILYERHDPTDDIKDFLIKNNFSQIYNYFNNYIFINNNYIDN